MFVTDMISPAGIQVPPDPLSQVTVRSEVRFIKLPFIEGALCLLHHSTHTVGGWQEFTQKSRSAFNGRSALRGFGFHHPSDSSDNPVVRTGTLGWVGVRGGAGFGFGTEVVIPPNSGKHRSIQLPGQSPKKSGNLRL